MPTLTRFQTQCEDALIELFEHRNWHQFDRELVQNAELIIHISTVRAGRDLEVWIYEDEVEYRFEKERRNFESCVFPDDSERISSFVSHIQSALKG